MMLTLDILFQTSPQHAGKKLLRTCMDKVMINMSNTQNIRNILEKLKSVARTNG